jgi:acetyl-CoA acetyltransferase
MPEAVIVATARTPIGRAFKGSLKDLRPDDLAAFIIRTALQKVPQLDPEDIDDLMLGCGLPGGEQGFNMARVVAVLLGYDHLPGVTLTRYCASSLQTTRMAFHAIKAGEGDVFISAGVEMVSRYVNGNSDSLPDTMNPAFASAHGEDSRRRRGELAAAQVIPSYRDLGIDINRLNVNGGAIAVGHPFGMTGARITTTLINSLQFHDKQFGLETMCVGGGRGMALVLERLS